MSRGRDTIGFDRKIELDWLDATAGAVAGGLGPAGVREHLQQLLDGVVAGSGHRSARDKTVTVLTHVWASVPEHLAPLRDEGLQLLEGRRGLERLPVHWGMCLVGYPFFRDVVQHAGRLITLQGAFNLHSVTRRMAEVWGDRSTVTRATQRVVRSMVLWGALAEGREKGSFALEKRLRVGGQDPVGPWLVESLIAAGGGRPPSLRSVLAAPALFPFQVEVSAGAVRARERLEVHRRGLDEDVVVVQS